MMALGEVPVRLKAMRNVAEIGHDKICTVSAGYAPIISTGNFPCSVRHSSVLESQLNKYDRAGHLDVSLLILRLLLGDWSCPILGKERTSMIRRMVLVVGFAVLVPCLAMAGGVSFTTTGTLSNPTLFPLTFTGTSVSNFVGGNLAFGMFNVTACPVSQCKGSETFTLQIAETSPVSGTADLVGTISGDVLKNGHTNLTISFTTATVTIGSTAYTIPFMHSINFSLTTLNGSVAPTSTLPEPSAGFLLGMGALGLMGLATVSRKSITV
jgi:hypothetical protein